MSTISLTIFYTLLFSLAMEFQINVLIKQAPANMIGVILLYAALGAATYYTFPYIMKRFNSAGWGFVASLTIHGLVGLILIEWIIIGNTPQSIPDPFFAVVAQLGMFAWWCTIAAMPYILQHPAAATFKNKVLWYYGAYAVISTILAIIFGLAPIILLEPPVYLGFFYFYYRFACSLK